MHSAEHAYPLHPKAAQTKKGRISPDMVAPYEQYYGAIGAMCAQQGLTNVRVVRLATHHGAMSAIALLVGYPIILVSR